MALEWEEPHAAGKKLTEHKIGEAVVHLRLMLRDIPHYMQGGRGVALTAVLQSRLRVDLPHGHLEEDGGNPSVADMGTK